MLLYLLIMQYGNLILNASFELLIFTLIEYIPLLLKVKFHLCS
jgi:hypothetical protein